MRFLSTIHRPLFLLNLSLRHKIWMSKQLVLLGVMFVAPYVSLFMPFLTVPIFAYRTILAYISQKFKSA